MLLSNQRLGRTLMSMAEELAVELPFIFADKSPSLVFRLGAGG